MIRCPRCERELADDETAEFFPEGGCAHRRLQQETALDESALLRSRIRELELDREGLVGKYADAVNKYSDAVDRVLELQGALEGLLVEGCFCEVGIGHPLMNTHSDACERARAAILRRRA
jgi:hypothetical protein